MAYQDVILADTPVGYWRLNEVTGTIASDSSGNGNHGTLTGALTLNQPTINSDLSPCLSFNGGYVHLPTAVIDPVTASSLHTVEAWISINASSVNSSASIYMESEAPGGTGHYPTYVLKNASGVISSGVNPPSGGSVSDQSQIVQDTTYHIVYVRNGATVKYYVNGVLTTTHTGVEIFSGNNPDRAAIGTIPFDTALNIFYGLMKDVAVYDFELSYDRVKAHYYAAAPSRVYGVATSHAVHVYNNSDQLVGSGTPDANGVYAIEALDTGASHIVALPTVSNTSLYKPQIEAAVLATPSDPDYASVVSMLHFEGLDTTTTVTDEKGISWTAVGNAALSTTQKKFGNTSLALDGDGDYIENTDGSFSSLQVNSTWTIEGWIYSTANNATYGDGIIHFGNFSTPTERMQIGVDDNGSQKLTLVIQSTAGGIILTLSTANNTINLNQWHHVSVVNDLSTIKILVDGVEKASASTPSTNLPTLNGDARIGAWIQDAVYRSFTGYIDEFRITQGVARYTANFTPYPFRFPDA